VTKHGGIEPGIIENKKIQLVARPLLVNFLFEPIFCVFTDLEQIVGKMIQGIQHSRQKFSVILKYVPLARGS